MAKNTAEAAPKITPQDLENKLKALQGDVQGKVDDKKSTIATTAAAGGMVLLVIFFLLGRRSGKNAAPSSRSAESDVAASVRPATEGGPSGPDRQARDHRRQSVPPADRDADGGPGVYLRRSAIRQGLILVIHSGESSAWPWSARKLYRRGIKKTPEHIAVERIGTSHRVSVEVTKPNLASSRRQRRGELRRLEAQAQASVEARLES